MQLESDALTATASDAHTVAGISNPHVENSPRLHVLIVDDEALLRWAIAETLVAAGCEVSEAGTANETLQRLSSAPVPDVIFLDFQLPDSNELSLLESVLRMAPDSPVLMMSADVTPEMQNGAQRLGARRTLRKPLDMPELVPLVDEVHRDALKRRLDR